MSQLRIYVDGKPAWLPESPARARPVGFGGAALGTFSGTTLTAHQRRRNEPKKRTPRQPLGRKPGEPR